MYFVLLAIIGYGKLGTKLGVVVIGMNIAFTKAVCGFLVGVSGV